jgi:two-component system, OmpR family, response regulator
MTDVAAEKDRPARMDETPHILVVDDDREIRDLISRFLKKNGYRVTTAANGKDMRAALVAANVDLIVLDRVMPGEDGLNLCRDLRQTSRVPIILLTLLGSDTDRIVGLEMGADDYITKPFNPQELLARIKAVLRRANDLPIKTPLQRAAALSFSGWTIDRAARELTSPDDVLISLTDGEFDLLIAFAEHPQLTLTRDQLLDLTRGRSAIAFDRSIDMQMTRLRRKIEADPDEPEFIKTVRNKGYIFTPEVTVGKE